jgi:hypothetical protein
MTPAAADGEDRPRDAGELAVNATADAAGRAKPAAPPNVTANEELIPVPLGVTSARPSEAAVPATTEPATVHG